MKMFGIKEFIILFLIFIRISATFVSAPVFGSKVIPLLAKLFLALVVSYIIFLTIDTSYLADVPTGWMLVIFAIKEALTGLTIGFMMQFVFYGISYAGTLIGFDMGLNTAEVFNPNEEINGNVIGEVLYYGALLVFFLINGHHYLISSLKYSFSVVPVGEFSITQAVHSMIIKSASSVFIIAVKIASPIIVSFFLVHIAEGIISRLIPQMQVFFVTQPLKIGLGLVILTAVVPIYVYVIKNLLKDYERQLTILIQNMSA